MTAEDFDENDHRDPVLTSYLIDHAEDRMRPDVITEFLRLLTLAPASTFELPAAESDRHVRMFSAKGDSGRSQGITARN